MSIVLKLIQNFNQLLTMEMYNQTFDYIYGMFSRNLATVKTDKQFNFFKMVAYGNAMCFGSSELKKLIKTIITFKTIVVVEEVIEEEVDLTDMMELENSVIDFNNHQAFWKAGRCFICGRTLTNKVSIDIGIGPICNSKYGGISPLSAEEKAVAGMLALDGRNWMVSKSISTTGKSVTLYMKSQKKMRSGISIKGVIFWKGALMISPYYIYRMKNKFGLKQLN